MNAITNFAQFHQALTNIANNPAIGVVPTDIVNGSIVFTSIDDMQVGAKSLLNIDFKKGDQPEWDVNSIAQQLDDEELADDVGMLRSMLNLKAADLLPVDTFYTGQAASELAVRRELIASQLLSSFHAPDGVAPMSGAPREFPGLTGPREFSGLTVRLLAERLARLSFLHGGGYGYADLAKSILTRAHLQRHNASVFESQPGTAVDPADSFFTAGVLFANMGIPWSLDMAEFSFAAAAQEFLGFKAPRDVAAAVTYGLAADMRDRREGGLEQYNPMRSAEASQWLKSISYDGGKPILRLFMGLSSALRAGRMDLYSELASIQGDVAFYYERRLELAGSMVREALGLSKEGGPKFDEIRDTAELNVIMGNLAEAAGIFKELGEAELSDDVASLVSAGADFIGGSSPA